MEVSEKVRQLLNTYISDKVWNEPVRDYRTTLVTKALSPTTKMGTWDFGTAKVALPDSTKRYYVLGVSKRYMGGLYLDCPNWTKASEFLNNDLDIRMHDEYGQYFYRDEIYLHNHPHTTGLIVCLEKNMVKKVAGSNFSVTNDKLYISTYLNVNRPNKLNITRIYVDGLNSRQIAYNTGVASDTVFVNGDCVKLFNPTNISIGDYVEAIKDPNMIAKVTIDPDTAPHYISDLGGHNMYIVHIPKNKNPNNLIITYNTCDLYATRKDNPLKGCFIRFNVEDHKFVQLTHNDFAIPDSLVNEYKAVLGGDITIDVVCRSHDPENKLIRDKNYVDVLYSHNDEDIIKFLTRTSDFDITFWSAQELEHSQYNQFMFGDYKEVSTARISEYVDAIGFFHALSLICPRVNRFVVTAGLTNQFTVYIPMLFGSRKVTPHVFLDGVKLADALVTTNRIKDGYMAIVLDPSVKLTVGQELVVELFEDCDGGIFAVTPSIAQPTLTINSENIKVFRQKTLPYTRELLRTPLYSATDHNKVNAACAEVDPESVGVLTITPGKTVINFDTAVYGQKLIIQSCQDIFKITDTFPAQQGINALTTTYQNLVVDVKAQSRNPVTGELYADVTKNERLHGDLSYLVYLNGRALVRGVDYDVVTAYDLDGNDTHSQVVIQNVSYIQQSNFVEIYASCDFIIEENHGFALPSNKSGLNDLFIWFNNLSMSYAHGYIRKATALDHGFFNMVFNDAPEYGRLCGARTVIPESAKEYLSSVALDEDTSRIQLLHEYFNSLTKQVYNDVVLIRESHKIYSVYINTIVDDLVNNRIAVDYDRYTRASFTTLFAAYERLKALDIVFTKNLDLRFVDVYPSYQRRLVANPKLYKFVQDFIKIIDIDKVTDGDLIQ